MGYLGALHLHSTYSDGEFTLTELRDALREQGCRFACVTDHAEFFDEARRDAFIAECERLSSDEFRFVPGLEFNCRDKMHILGYGVTELVESAEPEAVIARIREHGGRAVIAHPKDSHFAWIESFQTLPDGIETWNTKYDGRYAPRPRTFALLNRLQERQATMKAYYGIDLHWRRQYRRLLTEVSASELSRDAIMYALANGAYQGRVGPMILPASGVLTASLEVRFRRRHDFSDKLRHVARGVKKAIEGCGAQVPQPIKNQLRRFF